MHILHMAPPKSLRGMFMATFLPSLGILPPKFQNTCLGYWQGLLPNLTLISEVPVEKTVTKQKKMRKQTKNSKLSILPILHMEG